MFIYTALYLFYVPFCGRCRNWSFYEPSLFKVYLFNAVYSIGVEVVLSINIILRYSYLHTCVDTNAHIRTNSRTHVCQHILPPTYFSLHINLLRHVSVPQFLLSLFSSLTLWVLLLYFSSHYYYYYHNSVVSLLSMLLPLSSLLSLIDSSYLLSSSLLL